MNKILVIGQAPPAQKQTRPYDTTMLYEWLDACGISKDEAQQLFEFEAVSNVFPGHGASGHKPPTADAMEAHWPRLAEKIKSARAVLVLGRVAARFLEGKGALAGKRTLYMMHPSRRNAAAFLKTKDARLAELERFLS